MTALSRRLRLAFAAAGLALTMPASAAPAVPPAPELAAVDAALPASQDATRGSLQLRRARALRALGRPAEALLAAEEAAALLPDAPDQRRLIAELQFDQRRALQAARTVVGLGERFPSAAAELPSQWVRSLVWRIDATANPQARFDLVAALTRAGFTGRDEPGAVDWIVAEAIEGLIARGRADEARRYVAQMLDPTTIVEMLVDRRYQPLWPDLEARAGPGGVTAATNLLEAIVMARAGKPADLSLLQAQMAVLRVLNRPAEAAALAYALLRDMKAVERGGEPMFWLADLRAAALAEAGRLDAAERLLAQVVALGLDKHPELISLAINRVGHLSNYGRAETALRAATALDAKAAHRSSAYGRMWILQARSCAAVRLRRGDEATATLGAIAASKAANPAAYMKTLLCHDRLDEAETVAIERLADPDQRGAMLRAFQDSDETLPNAPVSLLRHRLLMLRDRPTLRQAIQGVGRILPPAPLHAYAVGF